MIQPELSFTTSGGQERMVPAESVQALRNALSEGGWMTAKELARLGFDDRELRVIVEHHGDEFVTGNKGYRLMSQATVDEIRQSADRMEAQAKKMLARVLQLRNAAHRRLHVPTSPFSALHTPST